MAEALESLSSFMTAVNLHVMAAPTPVKMHAIRQAVMEFADRSLYWQEDAELSPAEAGFYTPALPANTLPVEVVRVVQDGEDVPRYNGSQTDYYTQGDHGEIYLALSNYSIAVTVTMAVKPSQDATTAAKRFYDHYLDAIASGAAARLFAQPGKDWSAPNLVEYHNSIFTQAHSEAARVVANGFRKRVHRVETNPLSKW